MGRYSRGLACYVYTLGVFTYKKMGRCSEAQAIKKGGKGVCAHKNMGRYSKQLNELSINVSTLKKV